MSSYDFVDGYLEHMRGTCVGEELRRSPHEGPSSYPLNGLYACSETTAAEECPKPGAETGDDREVPNHRVIGWL